MKVGDQIWHYNDARRHYRKDKEGNTLHGGPIWIEHWEPAYVIGETSRSWLVVTYKPRDSGPSEYDLNAATKIPKSGELPGGFIETRAELERAAWMHDHSYRIGEAVGRLGRIGDYGMLKRIAEMIGYKDEVGEP